MCDTYGVKHPPASISKDDLIKTIITTPTLQGGKIKTLLNQTNFMNLWKKQRGGSVMSKKTYPINFQKATQDLIKIISFNPSNVRIMGTMSYKAYLYPSDYDLFESVQVKNIKDLVSTFQNKIKTLLKLNDVYIGDIKAGEYEPFKIINERAYFKNNKVVGYDYEQTTKKLKTLLDEQFINKTEYTKFNKLIKKKPTKQEWNIMLKKLRLHVLRWSPQEVIQGFKEYKKHKIYLVDVLSSQGLFKLDVIAYINNKFSEFSIIYDLRESNKRINNFKININEDLKSNINQLQDNSQYFKMLKRILSLMRVKINTHKDVEKQTLLNEEIKRITNILNGELGIINNVANEIEILTQILENEKQTPLNKVKEQIDNFIYRLSNIYQTEQYLKNETTIIKDIHKALSITTKPALLKQLDKIRNKLLEILNHKSKNTAMEYADLF